MGVELGLAAGIGQGLQAAVQTYLQTQNMLQQQEINKRLANAQSTEAYAKLFTVGGKKNADQFRGLLGLSGAPDQAQGAMAQTPPSAPPVQGVSGPSVSSPSVQTQPNPTQPKGMLAPGMLKPDVNDQNQKLNGGGIIPNNFLDMSQSERALYAPAIESQLKAQTPEGQLAISKSKVDLKNAQMDQFNKGVDSFKTTKETFSTAADAYGKLMKVTNDASPKNLQSALMQVIKLDMPRQAVRMGSLSAMEQDPQIMQRWGNQISKAQTGVPSDLSIQDLQRVGTNLYVSNSAEFRSAQNDERANARVRGVDPTYVNVSYADKMDRLAQSIQKNLPKYQPATAESTISQINPSNQPGPMSGIQNAVKGAYTTGKNTLNAVLPGMQSMNANDSTSSSYKPHPDDQKAVQWANKNPNSPLAGSILKANGVAPGKPRGLLNGR